MPSELNREVVNDRAKLLMHRLVARRLARDPSLVNEARAAMARLEADYPDHGFVGEWRAILTMPSAAIRSLLTRRSEAMRWLRLSSPFMEGEASRFLRDPDIRRRIWRLARTTGSTTRSARHG